MNKTVIITGGNSGLGFECARVLAAAGDWHIVIASRNPERVDAAVAQLKAETGHEAISGLPLDLGSFDSIRMFAAQLGQKDLPSLRAIVCNAGLTLAKNQQTVEGVDMTFGVNHLGHYLLVHLLSGQLVEPARVVFVSSGTHLPEHKLARRTGVPRPKYVSARDLAYPDEAAEGVRIDAPAQRYSTSKLCNVLATYEFDRQFKRAHMDVGVFAIDPGLMPGTGLARDVPAPLRSVFFAGVRIAGRWVDGIRLPEESGQHLARLVTDESLNGRSGLYFDGLAEVRSSIDSYDLEKAADLWNTSTTLCHLRADETVLPLAVRAETKATPLT